MNFTTQSTRVGLYVGFCILLLMHVSLVFCGFYGNDDINYARYAGEMVNTAKLTMSSTDHFPLRVTCIFATAFFYYCFGFTTFSTALFSYLCLILTSFFLYKLLKKQSLLVLLPAFVLFFFNFQTVFYAHRLLPDSGICLFVFVGYYAYYRMRFLRAQAFSSAVYWSGVLMLAVLTKESVIITVPFWLFLFLSDCFFKRHFRFWLFAIAIFAFLGGLYLIYFELETGDFFFRYHALNRYSLLNGGITYQAVGLMSLIKRLFFDLWHAFLLNGDFEYLAFAIVAFVYRKSVLPRAEQRHIGWSFLILLLSSNFMSYSINGYNPLLPDPRHFMFLIPFAAVAGGYMIEAYWTNPRQYFMLPALFVLFDIWLLFSDIGFTKYVYFGITIVLFTLWFVPATSLPKSAAGMAMACWVLVMGLNYINDFVRPRYPFYHDHRFVVKATFNKMKEKASIYTGDDMTAELSDFFLEFKNVDQQFVNVTKVNNFKTKIKSYILVNGDYDPVFKNNVDAIIEKGAIGSDDLILQRNNVFLYRISDTTALNFLKKISSQTIKEKSNNGK